jgi:hypothetical protein
VKTPAEIRGLGGTLCGDDRYGRVFVGVASAGFFVVFDWPKGSEQLLFLRMVVNANLDL